MRIVDRYLLKSFLASAIYCLLVFFLLFIIIDLFNHLDDFLKNNTSVITIFTYYCYFLPSIFVQVMPIATLVSVLFVIGELSRHNEIVALKASGVSAFHILLPYFFMGILISFSVLLVNETVVPETSLTSAAIMEGLIEKGKTDFDRRSLDRVTLYGKDDKMIYAREYEISTKTLHDIVIFENNLNQPSQKKLKAKKAIYEDGRWVFYETIQYTINRRGEIMGSPDYSARVEYPLKEKPQDFVRDSSQVEFMNTRQLKDYILHLEGASKKLVQKLSVDLHYKIAFPFVSFVVMLIGAPMAMRTGRGGAIMGISASFMIVFLYYGIDSICLALGKGGYLPPVFSAWFSNLLFALIGIHLIRNTA